MSRFALSPLWELTQALRLLASEPRQRDRAVLRPWLLRARDRYAEQSEVLANFIGYLGLTLSVIFSIGATIGAVLYNVGGAGIAITLLILSLARRERETR